MRGVSLFFRNAYVFCLFEVLFSHIFGIILFVSVFTLWCYFFIWNSYIFIWNKKYKSSEERCEWWSVSLFVKCAFFLFVPGIRLILPPLSLYSHCDIFIWNNICFIWNMHLNKMNHVQSFYIWNRMIFHMKFLFWFMSQYSFFWGRGCQFFGIFMSFGSMRRSKKWSRCKGNV